MLIALLGIVIPPLGAPPKTWARYQDSVNVAADTFTCFDGSAKISLAFFNDGILDCPDGSDEPSTSANPNSTFYCGNGKILSHKVKGWSVGDGICDCCDGSDESTNPHSQCNNTCSLLETRLTDYRTRLTGKLKGGWEKYVGLVKEGGALLNNSDSTNTYFQIAVNMISKFIRGVEKNAAIYKRTSHTPSWGRPIKRLWRVTFLPKEKPERTPLLEGIVAALASDVKKLIERIQKKVGRTDLVEAMRNVDPAAAPLYGKKFDSGAFKLKFLKKIKQRDTLIGRFANISNNTMYFDNGEHCWKTNEGRTFELQLVCNDENVFLEASEPTICVYKGTFGTPVACTEKIADGIDQLSLKKLEKMMDELHLSK
jgi:hypothetical protein